MLAVPEGAPKEYPCNLCQYYTKDEKCLAIHQPGCPLREMFGLKMIEKVKSCLTCMHFMHCERQESMNQYTEDEGILWMKGCMIYQEKGNGNI